MAPKSRKKERGSREAIASSVSIHLSKVETTDQQEKDETMSPVQICSTPKAMNRRKKHSCQEIRVSDSLGNSCECRKIFLPTMIVRYMLILSLSLSPR